MRQINRKNSKLEARSSKLHGGFTFMEAILVVALMGVVAVMAMPFLSGAVASRDLEAMSGEAVDALREAQISVMSGKNNARFGVHFEEAKFVFFEGAAYGPADPNNVEHSLSQIRVISVTLSPGGACTIATGAGNCDVHFTSRRGVAVETGSIVFTDGGGATKTVSINAAGMVDVN